MSNDLDKGLTYRHRHWVTKSGEMGRITACCELNREESTVRVAFSFCSPKEKQFVKRKGRDIARGRLLAGQWIECSVDLENKELSLFYQISDIVWNEALLDYDAVLQDLGRDIPQWIYNNYDYNLTTIQSADQLYYRDPQYDWANS